MNRNNCLRLLVIIFAFAFVNFTFVKAANYGIKVNSDGSLTINGQNFKAMGLNVVDLVWTSGSNIDSDFATLKGKTPFIRVAFGGWKPEVYDWYYKNQSTYFAITDKIIKKAEENQIGIIIDFFWYHPTFFYYNNEQLADMGNPSSKSVVEAKKFVTTIINRYKNSPAVWGYEIGNEYNLDVDLYRPSSPPFYTITKNGGGVVSKDFFTTNELVSFYTEIGNAIKSADSTRFLTTGDAAARAASYSLYRKTRDIYFSNHKSWSENFDSTSMSNYKSMITKLNPSPIDMVSFHMYKAYFNSGGSIAGKSFSDYLGHYVDQAKTLKKGAYLGEFGFECSITLDDMKSQINAIKNSSLQLSSIWLGSDGRVFNPCGSFSRDDLIGLLSSEVVNYNSSYQTIINNAWSNWKKTITVNTTNASYNLTKSNNYNSNVTSNYYLENDIIKITATPSQGYQLVSITAKTASGSNITISNNQFTMPNENVIITVTTKKIETPKYIVTFNSDGGSSVASQTIQSGASATKPANPTKNGYTFKEWQLNGATYKFTEAVTSNITLKAVWLNYVNINATNVASSTYIIGKYMFTRNTSSTYDGSLTTKRIMLAARTLTGTKESDMIIYYKNASGKWINALTGTSITPPTSFQISVTDLNKTLDVTPQSLTTKSYSNSSIAASTYVIGKYMFNRNTSSTYDGSLTTKRIMLASKSLSGNKESDMIIYYKRATGTWIDALTGTSITPPTSFQIGVVNLVAN